MPDAITIFQPGRLLFGSGVSTACAADIADRGLRRVFLLTSPGAAAAAEPLAAALRSRGLAVEIDLYRATAAAPEPTFASLAAVLARARAFAPDAVVGLGGGSVLDLAKLVAAMHDGPQDIREAVGIDRLAGRRTHLACLPTTAGTGSEVSRNAILLDEADHLKKGIISHWLVPDATYIDPDLGRSVPAGVTAATGVDALVHCIEAYANRFAHPMIDLYALEGIRLIGAHLVRAVRDGSDREARAQMALGSLYGGICLGPVNTAAVHALAYPLGGEFHIAHGVANALLLVPVLQFNLPAAVDRYAAVARALGVVAANDGDAAAQGLARLDALCADCGIPRKLSALGIPAEAIPRMAAAALTVTRLMKNNPRTVTRADAEKIYADAF